MECAARRYHRAQTRHRHHRLGHFGSRMWSVIDPNPDPGTDADGGSLSERVGSGQPVD